MSITLSALQKQRRDTAANWTAENPTLLAGEIGLESDTGYWKVGNGSTAWTSLAYVTGLGAEIPVSRLADGTARQLLQTAANGTDVEWTSNVDVPGTLDVTGAATFDAGVTIQGDLTVNGTTTTIDTQNLIVEDKNVVIGQVTTPTDVTADGGGITLKGSTDKTINWVDATDAWTLSEHVNIASAKEYRIAGTKVLDATSLGSSVLITSANITDGTIVNGDVSATAAIAGTKISPDFGSQNVTTTGTITAASFIPTSSTAPTNGVYLPAANSVAISTNGTQRLTVDTAATTSTLPVVHPLGAVGTPSITFTGDLNTGIWSPAADTVAASTGGSERLRIDSSGRVGIGTSSPQRAITAQTNANGASLLLFRSSETNNDYGGLEFGNHPSDITNYRKGAIYYVSDGTGFGRGSIYICNDSAGDANNVQPSDAKVVITSGGSVGIGTTSPTYQLQLSTDSAGKPSTNTWTIVSDERIKDDIEPADLDICYDAVKNIPLKRFKWKDEVYTEEQVPDRHKIGWIAQDVEAVFPKAVRISEFKYGEEGQEVVINDCRDLNADQLYAAMYGTIQKLIAKVETLEAEVAALKAS